MFLLPAIAKLYDINLKQALCQKVTKYKKHHMVYKMPWLGDRIATACRYILATKINEGGRDMNVADRIQNLRKIKGISQEQLAEAIGVSRQAVSKWESEQSTPDLDKIVLMSDFFDVTTDYLLKGIEPTNEIEHMTVGDVIDNKILTDTNGKRMKIILRYVLYVFIGVLAVDLLSFIIYVIIFGLPM